MTPQTSGKRAPCVITAVPQGEAWQIKYAQGEAAIYSGSYQCRGDALRVAETLAILSGGSFRP
jgi:hypothetical protein